MYLYIRHFSICFFTLFLRPAFCGQSVRGHGVHHHYSPLLRFLLSIFNVKRVQHYFRNSPAVVSMAFLHAASVISATTVEQETSGRESFYTFPPRVKKTDHVMRQQFLHGTSPRTFVVAAGCPVHHEISSADRNRYNQTTENAPITLFVWF